MRQQQLFNITERTVLALENKGFRFRVASYNGRDRILIYSPNGRRVKIKLNHREAAEYLTDRARVNIRGCRRALNVASSEY
jgi:hypothetical protein